jgi:hypothetical protein
VHSQIGFHFTHFSYESLRLIQNSGVKFKNDIKSGIQNRLFIILVTCFAMILIYFPLQFFHRGFGIGLHRAEIFLSALTGLHL